jgi:DNA-binding NarL/FixJ family response regulator
LKLLTELGFQGKKGHTMPASPPIARDKPTPREMEVLQLICQGCSTKQVASHLGITFKTAACHRLRLLQKAGVQNAIELFRWAIANEYVTVSSAELKEKPDCHSTHTSV